MKSFILLTTLLAVMGIASADEVKQNTVHQQQLSKRPYAAPVEKVDVLEGNVEETKSIDSEKRYKTLHLHQLGRRPYAEKNTD
jgi:hypothetical protein